MILISTESFLQGQVPISALTSMGLRANELKGLLKSGFPALVVIQDAMLVDSGARPIKSVV